MELDHQTVDAILAGNSPHLHRDCEGCCWLTLDRFTSCTDSIFERLVTGLKALEGIELGLSQISPHVATLLVQMEVAYLFLGGINELGDEAAHIIGQWPFESRPIRDLRIDQPLSDGAARALIGPRPHPTRCDSPLSVSLPSITYEVACALACHTHELYLDIRDQVITSDIGLILSNHAGYSLTLDSVCEFSDEMMQAIASNPGKRIRKVPCRNRVYAVDHDMWCSFYEDDELARIQLAWSDNPSTH